MFMGQNHQYNTHNHKRNPWGGVVGLERAPKPVVNQTELSRDNPVPEPARRGHGGQARPGGSQSHRSEPHPPSHPKPPRDAYSARGAADVAGRDFMDELDGDCFGADAHDAFSGGVGGADPSLQMWVTGTLPGAPKPTKGALMLGPHSRSPRVGAQHPGRGRRGPAAAAPNRRREGELSTATKKKVDKAVKLIRSILTSWDSSLRKTFNTIDADRGGTIDLDEFSDFVRRVLHLEFDRETMVGIMREFGGGHPEIDYQRFCEVRRVALTLALCETAWLLNAQGWWAQFAHALTVALHCFLQLVMGADRRDNSSLVMGNEHTAGDVHSNSEVSFLLFSSLLFSSLLCSARRTKGCRLWAWAYDFRSIRTYSFLHMLCSMVQPQQQLAPTPVPVLLT
jgi:hypothetical protein